MAGTQTACVQHRQRKVPIGCATEELQTRDKRDCSFGAFRG